MTSVKIRNGFDNVDPSQTTKVAKSGRRPPRSLGPETTSIGRIWKCRQIVRTRSRVRPEAEDLPFRDDRHRSGEGGRREVVVRVCRKQSVGTEVGDAGPVYQKYQDSGQGKFSSTINHSQLQLKQLNVITLITCFKFFFQEKHQAPAASKLVDKSKEALSASRSESRFKVVGTHRNLDVDELDDENLFHLVIIST